MLTLSGQTRQTKDTLPWWWLRFPVHRGHVGYIHRHRGRVEPPNATVETSRQQHAGNISSLAPSAVSLSRVGSSALSASKAGSSPCGSVSVDPANKSRRRFFVRSRDAWRRYIHLSVDCVWWAENNIICRRCCFFTVRQPRPRFHRAMTKPRCDYFTCMLEKIPGGIRSQPCVVATHARTYDVTSSTYVFWAPVYVRSP